MEKDKIYELIISEAISPYIKDKHFNKVIFSLIYRKCVFENAHLKFSPFLQKWNA